MRELIPNIATGTDMRVGKLEEAYRIVISRISEDGTIFADGKEQEFITFAGAARRRAIAVTDSLCRCNSKFIMASPSRIIGTASHQETFSRPLATSSNNQGIFKAHSCGELHAH